MSRSRLRSRRLGAILATSLFTIALMPGLAAAKDTRFLWVGAPDLTVDADANGKPDTNGILKPTKVSVPGTGLGPNATRVDVEIYNSGGQNLANTVLTINADANGLAGLDLDPDATYDPTGGNSASFCSASGDIVTCNFGSLPSHATRTVAVIVNVSAAFTATNTTGLVTASVTTNNENGTNTQTFNASSGTFKVTAFGADSVYTFELEGAAKHLFTSGVNNGGGKLSTDVTFDAANKELVAINEDTSGNGTTGFYQCPAGLACQSLYSEVSTTSGSFDAAPFFVWKLSAIVPKTYALSQGFVAHYPTGAKTFDFADTTNDYWILYFKDRSALCGDDIAAKIGSSRQCISSLNLTKFDKVSNLLEVTIVMDHQGGLKY